MYVEISPRQSGKTTRLVAAAKQFLQNNPNSKIAIVSHNRRNSQELKTKIINRLCLEVSWGYGMEWPDDRICRAVDRDYGERIQIRAHTWIDRGYLPPDYWFFDEFAYVNVGNLFPGPAVHNDYTPGNRVPSGVGNMIITNAYYCTTPSDHGNSTLDTLVGWCQNNGQEIVFHNPWTEQRLEEQQALSPYVRQHVLDYWVDYMTENGFLINGLKKI